MRRLLIGLAVLAVAAVTVIVLASRGGEDPQGETERGMRGFPLRGSLAGDANAVDSAVAEWREEIAEDEAEEDDDPDERARRARRPDPDDDITALYVGRVDEREEIAILEHRGLLAQFTRRDADDGWFQRAERVRTEEDFGGTVPIGIGDAILLPDRGGWRFVDAGYSGGYADVGDGLLWSDGGSGADGFVLPETASRDEVPVYVTDVGGFHVRPDDFAALTQALETGYERAVLRAVQRTASMVEEDQDQHVDQPPGLSVIWTGEAPGYDHAAVVLQGDGYAPRRAAALGYGDRPERSEEKDEGAVQLGLAGANRDVRAPNTFAAGTYTAFDDFPYLVLAGAGAVETVHALVGAEEVERKGVAIIDARRFDPKTRADTVVFGRTRDGSVIAPLQLRR